MSARAIKAMRGEEEIPRLDSDSEEEEEDERKPSASAFVMMDDSEEESAEEESEESSEETEKPRKEVSRPKTEYVEKETEEVEAEEDLDALVAEFQEKDQRVDEPEDVGENPFSIILSRLNVRDLDVDYATRNALVGGDPPVAPRKNQQAFLFGPAREGWTRPPNYIGGGIGMIRHSEQDILLPWPYSDSELMSKQPNWAIATNSSNWYTFRYSEDFERQREDFKKVQQMGDFNTLVMFVIHHPFVTEALLQVSTVLYQSNCGQEGLSLIRRCLWIFECSSLLGFAKNLDGSQYMDHQRRENATYFDAMMRLIKVSHIAGLMKTALGVSRFVLALDPLRDPMNTLLSIDYFALSSRTTAYDRWLVEFVESDSVHILYKDEEHSTAFEGSLLDMPNWKYSFALALYRLSLEGLESRQKADQALSEAVSEFPFIVPHLLHENQVDTSGRSFRTDWLTVLDFLEERTRRQHRAWLSDLSSTVFSSAVMQVSQCIGSLFVDLNSSLWSDEQTLLWLFDNAESVKKSDPPVTELWSKAVLRYGDFDQTQYERSFPLLPQDANIVDHGLVAQAMIVDTNRPRFLRRMEHHEARQQPDIEQQLLEGFRNGNTLFGPPTGRVDPDWPIAEVFWRSFLPWNHVEGVPPPRR